jgi:L-rhamnose mutarotase
MTTGSAIERHAQVVRVRPELKERYLELHRAVWPQVEKTLTESNITNYSIFNHEDVLFAYYEYTGVDHAADSARIAADPVTRDWWTYTDPCQVAFFEGAPEGQLWADLTEVWHLN